MDDNGYDVSDLDEITSEIHPDTVDNILSGDRERDNRFVATLLSTINAVSSSLDIRASTRLVVDTIVSLTATDRGILLLTDELGELRVEVARSKEGEDIGDPMPFSHSIPRDVLATGDSVCIEDTLGDMGDAFGDSVHALSLRAVMCAPLRTPQRVLGVMYVDSKLANREFTDSDVRFFEALTQQMAVTIQIAQLTQKMIQRERMASLGRSTRMILHDLANPITTILGMSELLTLRSQSPEFVAEAAAAIFGSAEWMQQMLFSLRSYASGDTSACLEPVVLSEFLDRAFGRLKTQLEWKNVELFLDCACHETVMMDGTKMERVLTNLVVNAMEAMPDGGSLNVSAHTAGPNEVRDEVRIVVADNGPGIPVNKQRDIFQPFVSLGKSQGTGLGLAIVKDFVELHDGRVQVESEEGEGTTFIIALPLGKSLNPA